LRIASERNREPVKDQVSHMQMLDPVGGGGEETSLLGLQMREARNQDPDPVIGGERFR
jgi:hypothetical protein